MKFSIARPLLGAVSALAAACMLVHLPARAAGPEACPAKADGASFVCNVVNVEDLISLPSTPWLVGSSLHGVGSKTPPLYLFDAKTRKAQEVQASDIKIAKDAKTYSGCPGEPDLANFSSHGLDYVQRGKRGTLYVVNHGGRESIEVFEVDTSGAKPTFTWTGCVVAPDGFWPDAVAALPGGGMVVTSLWDPKDNDRLAKLIGGKPVGALAEWYPKTGWKMIGPDGMSGPNGVVVTPDGKSVFVALWSGNKLMRLERKSGKATFAELDFRPDNLRWEGGSKSILLGGQTSTVKEAIEDCFAKPLVNCNIPFKVVRVDPRTLKGKQIVDGGVYGNMGAGTGALTVGNDLWVTTFRGDRLAIFEGRGRR